MKLPDKYCFKLFLSIFICFFVSLTAQTSNVVRAAIDIGSGGPKLRIAEVDLTKNKIIRTLYTKQYPVIFQESLSQGSDKVLSPEIMFQGLQAIKEAIALAKSFEVEGTVMVGTSLFRNAVNGDLFASAIHAETGIQVHLLNQELEAELAFQAVLAKTNISSENLIVWDIGGGSTQFIGIDVDGTYLIEGSGEGSGPFRDFIIESIQSQNVQKCKSPNPLSQEQADLAEDYAFNLSAKINQALKNKLLNPSTKVIGVGSVFGKGITSLTSGKNPFSIQDIRAAVRGLIGKSDADLGGGDFACIEVSNALLVLGFMRGLDIKEMNVLDVNNAEGAMVYKLFWEQLN